jgi:hypothetical protein
LGVVAAVVQMGAAAVIVIGGSDDGGHHSKRHEQHEGILTDTSLSQALRALTPSVQRLVYRIYMQKWVPSQDSRGRVEEARSRAFRWATLIGCFKPPGIVKRIVVILCSIPRPRSSELHLIVYHEPSQSTSLSPWRHYRPTWGNQRSSKPKAFTNIQV